MSTLGEKVDVFQNYKFFSSTVSKIPRATPGTSASNKHIYYVGRFPTQRLLILNFNKRNKSDIKTGNCSKESFYFERKEAIKNNFPVLFLFLFLLLNLCEMKILKYFVKIP